MNSIGVLKSAEEVRKYFKFTEIPDYTIINAYSDKRDGNIKYIKLDKVMIEADHPYISLSRDKNTGNFNMIIQEKRKGVNSPLITIIFTIEQIPISLDIGEDDMFGRYLIINTYEPLFNAPLEE